MKYNWELSSSLEDYLEAILELSETNSYARVKDIATALDVKRSSVTVALRTLGEKGYVNYAPYAVVTLTDEGYHIAECIRQRHHILKELFISLFGIEASIADDAACRMEHGMRPPLYNRIETLLKVLKSDPELFEKLRNDIISGASPDCSNPICHYGQSDPVSLIDLNGCTSGDTGVVRKIVGSGAVKKRYLEMGITVGQPIKVVKAAPMDDPIEIQVRNYRLSMRRAEAENILVEKKVDDE